MVVCTKAIEVCYVAQAGFGVRELVSRMESCLIELLASYGVTAAAKPDAPGVYVEGAQPGTYLGKF